MTNRIIKYILVLFISIFAIRVCTIFLADRFYSMSMAAGTGKISIDRGITLINYAIKIDSTNVTLHYKKYELLEQKSRMGPEKLRLDIYEDQLHILEKCIDLCPSWPAYHLYYAFTLKRIAPNPNIMTREVILSELEKAYTLKPYSNVYRKIYERHLAKFAIPSE